jgi:hypothetical protein
MSDDKTKQEYIGNFIRALAEVEAEMLPYQEHRKDLKKSYVQNGWLSKDETVICHPCLSYVEE